MKTMHLFAGVGGGLLADRILGHEPIVAVEWEPYACQVLRERAAEGWFPGLRVWEGDVRLFDPSEYAGRVDCIHAGFPCQDISVAGKQAGVGEETRSGLYREVLRIAGVVRPRYIYMENVSAIVTNGLGTVLGDLAALGYDSEWLCLRASDCGAAHHRDRWWLLADSDEHIQYNKHGGGSSGESKEEKDSKLSLRSSNLADSQRIGLPGSRQPVDAEHSASSGDWQATEPVDGGIGDFWRSKSGLGVLVDGISDRIYERGWWEAEPEIGRVATGIKNRVGQLKGLGNAQVPLQAAVAWKLLGGE